MNETSMILLNISVILLAISSLFTNYCIYKNEQRAFKIKREELEKLRQQLELLKKSWLLSQNERD